MRWIGAAGMGLLAHVAFSAGCGGGERWVVIGVDAPAPIHGIERFSIETRRDDGAVTRYAHRLKDPGPIPPPRTFGLQIPSWMTGQLGLNIVAQAARNGVQVSLGQGRVDIALDFRGRVDRGVSLSGEWSAVAKSVSVYSLASDPAVPTTVFAGGDGAVIKTVNAGLDWSRIPIPGLDGRPVVALAVVPGLSGRVLVGTLHGLWRTGDGGDHWEAVPGIPAQVTVRAIATDGETPTRILVGSADGRIYRALPGGDEWLEIGGAALSGRGINAIALGARLIYVATSEGVFVGDEAGRDWTPLNAGLTNTFVYSLVSSRGTPRMVLAGTFQGVFRIWDGSQSWSGGSADLRVPVLALAVSADDPRIVYAGTESGIYGSTSGGAEWQWAGSGIGLQAIRALESSVGARIVTFAVSSEHRLYRRDTALRTL